MSKRFYIATILGDGNADLDQSEWTPTTGELRPAVRDHNVPFGSVSALDVPWALVLVEAADHSALLADPYCYALPDVPMDVTVDAIDPNKVDALQSKLMTLGVATSVITGATSFRDIVRGIGQFLVPSFSDTSLPGAG